MTIFGSCDHATLKSPTDHVHSFVDRVCKAVHSCPVLQPIHEANPVLVRLREAWEQFRAESIPVSWVLEDTIAQLAEGVVPIAEATSEHIEHAFAVVTRLNAYFGEDAKAA
ncbi:hypothetical protein [Agromyces humi]|uniref:hypothetical protein n=1 Tax=Agromyces humi TaxID=1766800 RepID=UPI00135911DB|nr:hypothetical protein [Agromyces humi]